MANPTTGKEIIKAWFDRMEQVLQHEAKLAGLFNHGGTIGTAREFFVSRVLRAFLPPMIHIGTGQIIGTDGSRSNQIDVVVYDPRFPVLEVSRGIGLYLIEGVIATIEVKSTLHEKGLLEALDNCFSVIAIKPKLFDPEVALEKIQELKTFSKGDDPEGRLVASITPRTYIFGYRGYKTVSTMADVIQNWYQRKGDPGTPRCPSLPRVVVAGKSVGMSRDEGFPYVPDEVEAATINKKHGEAAQGVMLLAPTKRRFGMIALHLLRAVIDRIGTKHGLVGVQYDLYDYIPDREYFDEWVPEDVDPYWVVQGSTRPLPPEKKPAPDKGTAPTTS